MRKLAIIILSLLMASTLTLTGQSVNFKIGAFQPIQESDLWEVNLDNLAYTKGDLLDVYLGLEAEFPMGRYFTFSLELGHYRQDIYTMYKDAEYLDGTPIYQDFFLKITSLEADFKIYPIGTRQLFNPYFGGGVGLYAWKYLQGGEFVDWVTDEVYEGEAYNDAVSPGFNVKAGFVYRFKRNMGVSFEGRYAFVKGDLGSLFEGFEKFDLSGWTVSMGLNIFLR